MKNPKIVAVQVTYGSPDYPTSEPFFMFAFSDDPSHFYDKTHFPPVSETYRFLEQVEQAICNFNRRDQGT